MQENSRMLIRLQTHLFASNVHLEPSLHRLHRVSAFYVQRERLQVKGFQSVFLVALDYIQQNWQRLGLTLVWRVWLGRTRPTVLLLALPAVQALSPHHYQARIVSRALQASIPA
jgi:hypothetical protein